MPIFNNILAGASGQGDTGYDIDQSLRFNSPDDPYLSRTPNSASNRKTFTISCWIKKSVDTTEHGAIASVQGGSNDNDYFSIELIKSGSNEDRLRVSGWSNSFRITTRVFRDPSAWYHIVVACDSTQSTANDRVKVYVNGVQETDFINTTNISQDANYGWNQTSAHHIGEEVSSDNHLDGYLAEFYSIDGTALTPASFGETNSDTNQWVPIKYTGSYGTNGFYLKFQDSSALGDDSSGNTNDFTATNLAATDQMLDSPTNNFATLNPLVPPATTGSVFSEGNLKYRTYKTGGDNVQGEGTIGFTSGKWYWEIYLVGFEGSTARRGGIGVGDAISNETWTTACTEAAVLTVGNLNPQAHNVVNASTGTSWSTGAAGDIWCCAFDADDGTFIITKNTAVTGSESDGKWTGFATSTVGYRPITVEQSGSDYTEFVYNFGQDSSFAGAKTAQGNQDGNGIGDFYYTPPTGYLALCSDNLSDPSIADPTKHFNAVLWSGNSSYPRSITGTGFSTDLLWFKPRNQAYDNILLDSVRGLGAGNDKAIVSNATSAEGIDSGNFNVSSFDSDGFTMASPSSTDTQNATGDTYVAWNWKAGGTAVSNTDGSITSSVSANTTAGMSVVTWTNHNVTVGHGLSQAPELIIIKDRSATTSWLVYSEPVGNGHTLFLNSTNAQDNGTTYFNSTSPTSSVFSVGTGIGGSTDNYLAYCFHSVEGYSKVGSYTGNSNADGPMFYCGFKPSWAMFKATGSAQSWIVFDNKRNVYNLMDNSLFPDLSDAENDATSLSIDFVSNGIKIRSTHNYVNYSGSDYIVLAFAESPFKTSNAR